MSSERDRLLELMKAKRIEGRLRPLYFVSDLSTPTLVGTMWQSTNTSYIYVMAAEMPDGEYVPFFSPFGSHPELDEAIQGHYKELGLKEKPIRVIGAQFNIQTYDSDRLEFSYPMQNLQGWPKEQEIIDATLAVLRKVDPNRYSPARTLTIQGIGMPGIYSYKGGPTLIPPARR